MENKEYHNAKGRERYKRTYIPHPIKKMTEKEKRAKRKQFYEANKEILRERCRQYHLKHKDDENYKERKRINQRNYYKKKRGEKV